MHVKTHVYNYNKAQLPRARPGGINAYDHSVLFGYALKGIYTAILLGSSTHRKRIAALFEWRCMESIHQYVVTCQTQCAEGTSWLKGLGACPPKFFISRVSEMLFLAFSGTFFDNLKTTHR